MRQTLFTLILSIKRKCAANEMRIQDELHLTHAEFNGLLVMTDGESFPSGTFSSRMGLSPSRGSRVLSRLRQRGWIVMDIDRKDRRCVTVRLSRSGRALQKKIESRMQECEDRMTSHLDMPSLASIRRSLEILETVM
jgi:DNA-binding MarR family transcriptional regulator